MKYIKIVVVIVITPLILRAEQAYKTFSSLRDAAWKNLVPNMLQKDRQHPAYKTILPYPDIRDVLDAYYDYINSMKNLRNEKSWLGATPQKLFTIKKEVLPTYAGDIYEPFVEKRFLPVGSRVAIHGDLHGGFFELLEFIYMHQTNEDIDDNFKIVSDDFYLLFLGDYTDRGIYGLEVVYTLLRLKLANPGRVFFVRGNHEDPLITAGYGFKSECEAKFPKKKEGERLYHTIHYLYESFPVALYLGSGDTDAYYFQACHGGMEIGFDPKKLLRDTRTHVKMLLGDLNRKAGFDQLSPELQEKIRTLEQETAWFDTIILDDIKKRGFFFNIGFMWNDFFVDPTQIFALEEGRGYKYGKEITREVLANASDKNEHYQVVGVLRAHQHGDPNMMESIKKWGGISQLWDHENEHNGRMWSGQVCTFNVTPDTGLGEKYGLRNDTFGILTMGTTFADCTLEVARSSQEGLFSGIKKSSKSPSREKDLLVIGEKIGSSIIKKVFDFRKKSTFEKDEIVALRRSNGDYTLVQVGTVKPNYYIELVWTDDKEQDLRKRIPAGDLSAIGKVKSEYELVPAP
jgi:calcineurin-like phosphoesterase family protein